VERELGSEGVGSKVAYNLLTVSQNKLNYGGGSRIYFPCCPLQL
jgi:hypothetical protein